MPLIYLNAINYVLLFENHIQGIVILLEVRKDI